VVERSEMPTLFSHRIFLNIVFTMKIIKKQLWIPAGVYPCENRDGNDRGRSFRFLLP